MSNGKRKMITIELGNEAIPCKLSILKWLFPNNNVHNTKKNKSKSKKIKKSKINDELIPNNGILLCVFH